jgi:hypothetical protein
MSASQQGTENGFFFFFFFFLIIERYKMFQGPELFSLFLLFVTFTLRGICHWINFASRLLHPAHLELERGSNTGCAKFVVPHHLILAKCRP